MTRFLCVLCFFSFCGVSVFSQHCPSGDLRVFSPFTSQSGCVSRWKSESATLVIEKDCQACQKMLSELSSNKKNLLKKSLEIVISEENPEQCLREAIKVQLNHQPQLVWCSNRQNLQEIWQLSSTPVLFWLEGKSRQSQVGLFQQ